MFSNKKQNDSFTTEQQRIDRRQNAFRVLELMVQFQHRTEHESFDDGLVWTAEMIACHLKELDKISTTQALVWLLKREYVERRGNEWFSTKEGRAAFSDEIRNAWLETGAPAHEFRNEALTGMDRYGAPTRLTRAALPSSSFCAKENNAETRMLDQCEHINKICTIAAHLGLSLEETSEGLQIGRVRRCKGIDGTSPHWGVFHRHNGKNGKAWQSLCINCRKKLRRKR
jgi:hypothetical protein